jgi:hypothetical protein
MGYGVAGNFWKEVHPIKGPDLPYDRRTPSAGTIYLLFWGNFTKLWREK